MKAISVLCLCLSGFFTLPSCTEAGANDLGNANCLVPSGNSQSVDIVTVGPGEELAIDMHVVRGAPVRPFCIQLQFGIGGGDKLKGDFVKSAERRVRLDPGMYSIGLASKPGTESSLVRFQASVGDRRVFPPDGFMIPPVVSTEKDLSSMIAMFLDRSHREGAFMRLHAKCREARPLVERAVAQWEQDLTQVDHDRAYQGALVGHSSAYFEDRRIRLRWAISRGKTLLQQG
ncbi:MAG: hypothetical protein H6832_17415 [Planctomycetes bacterium]|nr:hypothetical protein [Planctomycetota bacterium]